MLALHQSPLHTKSIELYRSFLHASPSGHISREHLQEWRVLERSIEAAMTGGLLDAGAISAIAITMSNVQKSAAAMCALVQHSDEDVSILTEELASLMVNPAGRRVEKRRSNLDDSDGYRASKRNCRPTTTKYLPTPSPPPSTKSLKPSTARPPTAPDPVRQYFLTHLASPYPAPSEKERLCKKAKITRRKLESDLTNWRRRSDWTDIMNTYCGGDKSAMRVMVGAIERGEERDEELLERFGRMKAYLEKRDEQAGEWVHKLAEMVKSGRLDEMRFQQVDDSDADSNLNSESEREEEEDAEGESEDGNEYRNHPVPVPVPVTPLKEIPRYGKEVLGPYTTVPLDMTIPIPASTESPLSDLSPSSAGSYVPSIPSNNSYFNAKVQHPPPINYIHGTGHQPSTKSSYSSLSAVSTLAGGIRKRNISDSSTSSNLRSTSGSSTSSFPEKRQGRESFSRSRSRVEEVLSDNTTTSPWVDGHAPNQGFHIGYDPRYRTHPQPSYQLEPQERPPPYEMGPYVMAPSGWSSYDTTPMPMPMTMAHMTSGGKGGFTIPREYEFTFEHAHGHGQGNGYGDQGHARAQQ